MTIGGVDRELEPFLSMFPKADLTDPISAREKLAELSARAPAPDIKNMDIEDRTVPAGPGVPVRIYRPHGANGAIVWLHGGGFVMGGLDVEHPWDARIANGAKTVVVSVGYRLAPEHRFPAALDDAQSASARRSTGPWSARTFTDTPFMTRDKVSASWRHYLGSAIASPYAAPARAANLSGLPAAYVTTAEFDPNRDEAIVYAQRLMESGVPVELHQWRGTFHGSQAVLSAEVSQRQLAELVAVLRHALAG
jgi:acetyl esterase/lipase